jgi:hypothetical protein
VIDGNGIEMTATVANAGLIETTTFEGLFTVGPITNSGTIASAPRRRPAGAPRRHRYQLPRPATRHVTAWSQCHVCDAICFGSFAAGAALA